MTTDDRQPAPFTDSFEAPFAATPAAAIAEAAATFARTGHVRVAPLFAPDTAQALHQHLATQVPWSRVFNQGEQTWDLGPDSIAELDRSGDAPLLSAVHAGARDGFQYLYDSCRVADNPAQRADRGLLLDRVIDAMNQPETLRTLRTITGIEAIARADGQATRYLPGQFLTGHDDAVDGKHRHAAYVINLTPQWRTEWGGLLAFHEATGDLGHALVPCFNAIHLFRVPQVHSVTYVAPFAGAPRLSITGWLRSR